MLWQVGISGVLESEGYMTGFTRGKSSLGRPLAGVPERRIARLAFCTNGLASWERHDCTDNIPSQKSIKYIRQVHPDEKNLREPLDTARRTSVPCMQCLPCACSIVGRGQELIHDKEGFRRVHPSYYVEITTQQCQYRY